MRIRPLASLGLGLLLCAGPALAKQRFWDQSWTVTTRPDVHVVAEDAHVRVHPGAVGEVKAHVEFEARHWGLLLGNGQPVVVFEHKGDHIWINVRDPKGVGVIGGYEEHLVVDVTVPSDVVLSVRTGDGAVDCEPLNGQFTFETGDGAVRAHGLRGDTEVSSGDGRVILDDLDGKLRARAGDGHIMVSGRFDVLDLGTADGRVEATARKGSHVTAAWSVQTGDGAVMLRIPQDTAALLDARTHDGHITVELPIQMSGRLDKRALVGELNGGGPPLRIRTGDGSITLGLSQ